MDNFLQSKNWMRFQEASGRDTVPIGDNANGFIYTLPVVGRYLYTPRFPDSGIVDLMIDDLLTSANKTGSGWVRIEPETEEVLRIWKQSVFDREKNTGIRLVKAPHDMQPREVLVVDILKDEKDLLSEMKAKTRYNIRLAEKKGVRIFSTRKKKYQEALFELIEATAKRQNILPHPKSYYEKMLSVFSEEDLSLFVAEFEGYVLAANLILFSGDTAIYLHGGTSDVHREMMAPILLQWEQMREAKQRGCRWYDFGGVRTLSSGEDQLSGINAWEGITRFKLGFSPDTPTKIFPGCYDVVIDRKRYGLYLHLRFLQRNLSILRKFFRR